MVASGKTVGIGAVGNHHILVFVECRRRMDKWWEVDFGNVVPEAHSIISNARLLSLNGRIATIELMP